MGGVAGVAGGAVERSEGHRRKMEWMEERVAADDRGGVVVVCGGLRN